MRSRSEVIGVARSMVNTPWRHQGRLPGPSESAGVDCVGLVVCTGWGLGLTTFDTTDYSRHADWGKFLGYFRQECDEIPLSKMGPGDIICLRDKQYPCHCAIVGQYPDGALSLIHAFATRRKVVEERFTEEWMKLRVAAFRFRGVED